MAKILFSNLRSKRIKKIFKKTVARYKELEDMKLILRQSAVKGSTMQAQPIINFKSVFRGIDTFRIKLAIKVRDSKNLEVNDLPDEVLMGWFAHELGHVIDYHSRSVLNMIGFGLRYVLSKSFRLEVEHTADKIAIEKGFIDQILATKRFILDHHLIENEYKIKMKRYYMSEKDALSYALAQVEIDPVD